MWHDTNVMILTTCVRLSTDSWMVSLTLLSTEWFPLGSKLRWVGQHRQNQEPWRWREQSSLTGREGVYVQLPLHPEVTSSPPLCSQAENYPFWYCAQTEALHLLHHPSAAQHNLQPPTADLTLVLFPPAAAAAHCSGFCVQLLKMKIRASSVTIGQRRWGLFLCV